MDRNRLLIFFAVAAVILAFSELMLPRPTPHAPVRPPAAASAPAAAPNSAPGLAATPAAPDKTAVPRAKIDAARLQGSVSLLGGRIDDIALKDYHDTVNKTSPLVRVLEPADTDRPGSVQLGWAAAADIKVPDDTTLWTSSGGDLTDKHPLALTWDNGAGLLFRIDLAIDPNYMFTAKQSVRNTGAKPVEIWPWQRVRRDYAQAPASYSVLFEGMLGVEDGITTEVGYPKARTEAAKNGGIAHSHEGAGGWASFTDKYWLTAVIPDQSAPVKSLWFYNKEDGRDHYQVSYQTLAPEKLAPGGEAGFESRLFIGAKEVHLLDRYETTLHIPRLSYAVDWGRFFFLTKPFFYAIDWIYSVIGNFGVAILIFTVFVKGAFYPLARKSFVSMGKMRLLAPKIQAARERHKDNPAAQQAAMMEVYKEEGISPIAQAGGCLPLLIQIPVFFSLYKVILVTIEMRHAPFFGWIRDLSATDPTNIFNLFGLVPFNPEAISSTLHLGIWPVLLGVTMYFQQKLNPPPPDPAQARMFQFLPIVFTFMMGRFPAGLVIYWTWNNLLTMAQQWHIQRNVKLSHK